MQLTSFPTPNPNSFTFRIPSTSFDLFTPEGVTCEAPHRGLSDIHPFANQIFEQYPAEVTAVFIAPRYVTITKFPQVDWEKIEWSVASFVSHYLTSAVEPYAPKAAYALIEDDTKILPDDPEVVLCIKELIKEQIRPMVQRDGGDVKLLNFNSKTGIVSVAMLGACRTCPSSQNTLKDGIERMMKHFLPEVTEVVEVKGETLHQEYELKFGSEEALRKEAERLDRERRRHIRPPTPRGLQSFEALAEPDGDA